LPLLALLLSPLVAFADDPKAIIEKAIKAHGYKELAAGDAVSHKSKGQVFLGGQEINFTAKMVFVYPQKMRQDVSADFNGQKMEIVQVNSPKGAWMSMNDTAMDLPEGQQTAAKHQIHAEQCFRLFPLLKEPFQLEALPAAEVDGKKAVGVAAKAKDQPDVKLWFDADSGLLLKGEMKTVDGNSGNEIMQETIFKDCKDFDGVKRYTKLVIKRDGEKFLESEVSDWKKEDKVDDKLFDKPGAAPGG
jgi:hypothetical protein